MKTNNQFSAIVRGQAGIEPLLKRAADMGAEVGMFGVKHEPTALFRPQVKALAFHGEPDVDPAALGARAEAEHERANAASRRVDAFFDGLRSAGTAVFQAGPLFGWQGSSIVLLTAGIVSLSFPAVGWRTCAILVLSAALSILALPLLPSAFRFCLLAFRATLQCARDGAEAFTARRAARRLKACAEAAEDHTKRINQWIEVQMSYLAAEYEYHRSLAVVAGCR